MRRARWKTARAATFVAAAETTAAVTEVEEEAEEVVVAEAGNFVSPTNISLLFANGPDICRGRLRCATYPHVETYKEPVLIHNVHMTPIELPRIPATTETPLAAQA